MYCIKCGTKIEDNDAFCTNCGTKVGEVNNTEVKSAQNEVNQNVSQEETKEDKKTADTLCIISLILYFGVGTIGTVLGTLYEPLESLIYGLSSLSPLAGIVLMIIARVKYPKNKFAKILMWVYISLTAMTIVLTVVFIIACVVACGSLGEMGLIW